MLRDTIRGQAGAEVNAQYEQAAMILDRAAQFASAAAVTVQALNGGEPDPTALASARLVRAPASEEPAEDNVLWHSFRAMLSPGSLIVRFALRVAVVTTIAVALFMGIFGAGVPARQASAMSPLSPLGPVSPLAPSTLLLGEP